MKFALLRGREHVEVGAVAAVAEGPAAVALSVGGAAKTYAHTDPNEDAALFALGERGWAVAVADGHRGFEAAEVALEHLVANPLPHWTSIGAEPGSWARHATAVLADCHAQIQHERVAETGARTTLTFALVLPADATLLYATVGDSHLFRVRGDQVVDLAAGDPEAQSFFLGDARADQARVRERCHVGVESLAGVRALVLATDGISERGVGLDDPAAAVFEAVEAASRAAPELRPLEVARGLVERALDAHRANPSGDNAAVAVLWLGAR